MGGEKTKFEIDDRKEHYIIFRGKQRQLMTAMVWDRGIAELVRAALDDLEAGRTVRPKRAMQQRKGAIRPCCDICKKERDCGFGYHPKCGFRRITAPVA